MANRLQNSASPYLLQHAHNPVDWYPWGAEALERSRTEDKPILVSIGYASCHWCHVMERESFEDAAVAAVMNQHFVCIKVDREERPDIDAIYMEAVQAMGVNGGWPLHVFLMPDQRPYYGGTYFPKRNWLQLLPQLADVYHSQRNRVRDTAEQLARHVGQSELARFGPSIVSEDTSRWHALFERLYQQYDRQYGGLEKAPKFIMPSVWQAALRYAWLSNEEEFKSMVFHTLDEVAAGGIHDHAGGGFARYSVDGRWFAPHFEKMLYDNGQLLSLYAEAFRASGRPHYARVIRKLAGWLERELMHPEGGFYSALDADSEGVEGKFYTWHTTEVEEILGNNAADFINFYHLKPKGNWEHGTNILYHDATAIARADQWDAHHQQLLKRRASRVRPALDYKVVTAWNAMTISGLADAAEALGDHHLRDLATRAMTFLEQHLIADRIYRTFTDHRSETEGFLDDYAWVADAYRRLYELTFDEHYLTKSSRWVGYAIEHFYDHRENSFYYTSDNSEALIARKKEVFDNVIPSSNAVMARNLFRLGTHLQEESWLGMSERMVNQVSGVLFNEPVYMSHWALVAMEQHAGVQEIVITGPLAMQFKEELGKVWLPFVTWAGAEKQGTHPLLEGRTSSHGNSRIFVCQDRTCQLPVENTAAALEQIQRGRQRL
ncbi:MAG: thioredoxin domain-containing protein [Cyclobacteriaceae bacterium]